MGWTGFYFGILFTIFFYPLAKGDQRSEPAESETSAEALNRDDTASTISPWNGNILSSLHFYAPANHLEPTFTIGSNLSQTGSSTKNGQADGTFGTSNATANFSLVYGILDGLRITASDTYLLSYQNTFTSQGTQNVTNSSGSGFSDPTFTLEYRLLNESKAGLFADVSVAFTPSVADKTLATPSQNGNNARGYSTVDLSADGYWTKGPHEFGLGFSADINTSERAISDTTTNSFNVNSVTTFDIRARYRYHITDNFYLQPAAVFNLGYTTTTNYTNQSPVLTQVSKFPFTVTPRVGVGYSLTPSVLLTADFYYYSYEYAFARTNGDSFIDTTNRFYFIVGAHAVL